MEKNTALTALETANAAYLAAEAARDRAALTAKDAGASWADIARLLGITKQRAHQRYSQPAAARNTSRDHLFTPAENAAADEALAALQAAAARQDELQQHHAAAVEFLDGQQPHRPSTKLASAAPALDRPTGDPRPTFHLNSAGRVDGVAQPGTGKGPHACPRCGSTNHKGTDNQVSAYFDCTPTKYDPQDITDYLNMTGLKTKANK